MNLVYENEEKCNILNKYFCSVTHLENENKNLPDFDERGSETLGNIIVFEQDVVDIISTLNLNKAVGPDLISNKMLIALPLSMLFKKSLKLGVFPSDWKMSHVIPLFKKGDKSLVSNYRPVALLCCIRKVLEKIAYKHLYNHLHQNLLLYKFHCGCLPGHSTNHQLIELYHEILLALQCGKPLFSNTRKNGEWTETITRQDENELAMFGE
jgi:hypothetical protein